MAMKPKIDPATGKCEVRDGLPIWVSDDGSETTFDGPKLHAAVGATRDERDTAIGKVKALEAAIKRFGGNDEELDKALKRLELAKNIDDNKLVEKGKVDEVVAGRLKEFEAAAREREAALTKERDDNGALIDEILLEKAFEGSSILKDYLPTWSLLRHEFKGRLGREGKSLVGYRDDSRKERIYSSSDATKLASGDELLLALLKSHPDHDKWRKSSNATGTGAADGRDQPTTTDIHKLSPEQRINLAFSKGKQQAA